MKSCYFYFFLFFLQQSCKSNINEPSSNSGVCLQARTRHKYDHPLLYEAGFIIIVIIPSDYKGETKGTHCLFVLEHEMFGTQRYHSPKWWRWRGPAVKRLLDGGLQIAALMGLILTPVLQSKLSKVHQLLKKKPLCIG